MQVFTYICAILFLHLSNQEGFSVPSSKVTLWFNGFAGSIKADASVQLASPVQLRLTPRFKVGC